MSRQLGHSPATARRAEAPPLAGERDEDLVPAVVAAESGEATRHDTAREELPELPLDERGKPLPVVAAGSSLGEKRLEMLAKHLVEHAVLRAAPNVGAGPVVAPNLDSLPTGGVDGLHAMKS
jgi:hypothetical protein